MYGVYAVRFYKVRKDKKFIYMNALCGDLFAVVAFFCIVVYFYHEDNEGTEGGDEVGDDKGYVGGEGTLHDEEDAAEAHHAEGAEGYAFGVACADGDDGLGQVAEYHADACEVAYDGGEDFHMRFLWVKAPLAGRGRRRLCLFGYEGVCLFVVLKGADADAVPAFLFEHVADAFAFGLDAVGRNLVAVDEGFLYAFGAGLGELDVEVEVTVL